MTVIDHYIVSPHSKEEFNVHFNNTHDSINDKAIVQGILNGFITPLQGSAPGVYDHVSNTTSVYRKMSQAEVQATIANKGLAPSIRGTNSRKYTTDSLKKAVEFNNRVLTPEQLTGEKIVEFRVNRKKYQIIKQNAIPQLNAKKINPTADVYNVEGIRKGSSSVNLGIHKNNINNFNNNVKDILVLNPKSPWVKNNYLRYISTHKLRTACVTLSVIFEGVNIGIAVYQDGNKIGENSVHAISSAAGSIIGATILSIIPGVGTALGGFIGGLIGGFIGSGIGSLICSYFFPSTARGNGPPPIEYMPLIYGFPECEFKNGQVYGAPPTKYTPEYRDFSGPSNHRSHEYIPSIGVPETEYDSDASDDSDINVYGPPRLW